MTTLTFEAIEADRWNAVRLDLQADDHVHLRLEALRAALDCVEEAHDNIMAARAGELIPEGWQEGYGDVHEYYEHDWFDATKRVRWILLHTDWSAY
jgi:hypothetical protein